tara:strand:- start:2075 stop:2275 length:201 start_codon:yes stop_codon:yes gene_type:complete
MRSLASLRISGNLFLVSSILVVLSEIAFGKEDTADSVDEAETAVKDANPAHTQKGKIALKLFIKGI